MQNLILYIDPGSGSFIIQAVAASILGIMFFFKNIKLYIYSFFSRLKKKKDSNL